MIGRTRTRRVASLATLSLVCLAALVLAAVPAGAILGADMTISSCASSNRVEVGEQLVYTIDRHALSGTRRVFCSGNYPSTATPRSADTCS